MVKRAVVWIKSIVRWCLTELRLGLYALVVLGVAAWVVFRADTTELQIRSTGLILQLLGLVTVVHGIRETRRLFGRPSLVQLLSEKASRFPRWRRKAFIHTGTGTATLSIGGSVRAHVWGTVDPAAPIEQRVDVLTRNLERVNERVTQFQQESETKHREQSEALRRETQLREDEDRETRKLLETAETGGLDISLVGLLWLFVGLVLSTVSHEIAQWVR